ncbi:hypothetical protein ACS5PU_23110 [Pedobacter sp. GSP4]|uniref:hypothetical protein n=1 Tax=Pedobacter sp. GSP4 TaxID=3453716 RepID=UPI003EE85AC6
MEEEYKERPVWRTVLSIAIAIFAVIRLFVTCNQADTRRPIMADPVDFSTAQEQKDQQQLSSSIPNKEWNKLLYKKYKAIDSLSKAQLRAFYINKVEKDSLASIDMRTQLLIEKGFFFQNTHDDTLKFAFKTPKNLNVFVHDFESKASVEKSFKQLKAGNRIKDFKVWIKLSPVTRLVTYTIVESGIKFRGIAYTFNENDYKIFIEFESSTLSQLELQQQSISYIKNHIKVTK